MIELTQMRKLSNRAKQLIAEFLSNIGVAWFAAGVISIFISGTKTFTEIIISVGWGLLLSLVFLWVGIYFVQSNL